MSTKVMLQLNKIDSSEVDFHLDVRLRTGGWPGFCVGVSGIPDSDKTHLGFTLIRELETLDHISFTYGDFFFRANVPPIFDLIEVIGDIFAKIMEVVDGDIMFATTLGDDAFIKPAFITNPNHTEFDENIELMLGKLRQRP